MYVNFFFSFEKKIPSYEFTHPHVCDIHKSRPGGREKMARSGWSCRGDETADTTLGAYFFGEKNRMSGENRGLNANILTK